MYSYIKGNIEEINLDSLVIEANNIGYKVNVSSNTIASVKLGEFCKIYTKLIVREDDMSLCFKNRSKSRIRNTIFCNTKTNRSLYS